MSLTKGTLYIFGKRWFITVRSCGKTGQANNRRNEEHVPTVIVTTVDTTGNTVMDENGKK